jgi:hypothetical protein
MQIESCSKSIVDNKHWVEKQDKNFFKKIKTISAHAHCKHMCDSPSNDPTTGVTKISWILGLSAIPSIKYSHINDCAVEKRKE